MIEDGTVQTAATIFLGSPGNYRAEFQSDVDAVPEPSSIFLADCTIGRHSDCPKKETLV
jgi:hypothetical protein